MIFSWVFCFGSYICNVFLKAFGIFDPTYHGIMRSLYDGAINEYGRKVSHDYTVKTTMASPISDIETTFSGTSVGDLNILGDWIKFVVTLVIALI